MGNLRKTFQFVFFLFLMGVMFRVALPANAFDASKPISDTNPIPHQTTDHYLTKQYLAPNGEVTAIPLFKMVGDSFGTSTLDTSLWTASIGTGGSAVTSAGEMVLSTGTTANNATSLMSTYVARFAGLAPNKVRETVQFSDTGTANNVRRWGVYTSTDGAFFELNGTTFKCVTRKGGVDSPILNGAFNGQYGSTFTVDTNAHFYEIIYQPRQVVFIADNQIIHTLNAAPTPWSSTLHLPIQFENNNSGGSTTNTALHVRVAVISRFGIPEMQLVGAYQAGTTTGHVLKIGPGNVRSIVLSGVAAGSVITLYDNTAASGTILFSTGSMPAGPLPQTLDLGMIAFNTGLTLVISTAAANALVIYD